MARRFNSKIIVFQSDGSGEFVKGDFKNYLDMHGIMIQISCPGTPEQNRVAERKHRNIVELGLTIMFNGIVPSILG